MSMKICDSCMAKALRLNGKIQPHSKVFGANGTRWLNETCDGCWKLTDCVSRADLDVANGVVQPKTAAAN